MIEIAVQDEESESVQVRSLMFAQPSIRNALSFVILACSISLASNDNTNTAVQSSSLEVSITLMEMFFASLTSFDAEPLEKYSLSKAAVSCWK